MTELKSKVIIGIGLQAASAPTTAPVSYLHTAPIAQNLVSPPRILLPNKPDHRDNAGFAPLAGPIDVSKAYALSIILRGLSGNTGGAIDPDSTTDATRWLDALFGTDSIDPAGAVAAATGGTGASKIIAVDEMARFPVGTVIRFTTSAGTFIRQVRARAGASGAGNLTLDRTFTGTVDAANVVRAARWVDDPSVSEHKHIGLFAEYVGHERRLYIGGMGKWKIALNRGRYAELQVSDLRFTDVQDEAEADTAYVAPTVGSGLVRVNNKFFIGDDTYLVTDVEIEEGGNSMPREVDDSPHGVFGHIKVKGGDAPRTKIKAKVLKGTNTGELADSTGTLSQNKAQAWDKSVGDTAALWDVAIQAGSAAGAFGYGVMQQAVVTKADPIPLNGAMWLDCEFEACAPSASGIYQFEWHMG